MNCPKCRAENPDSFYYCHHCGARLAPSRQAGRQRLAPASLLLVGGGLLLAVGLVVLLITRLAGPERSEATGTSFLSSAPTQTPPQPAPAETLSLETRPPHSTAAPTGTPTPPGAPERTAAVVTDLLDGDTIRVSIDSTDFRLRYIGIDCPEEGDLLADEATRANRALVAGQIVYLEKDVSDLDAYDRLLRYVYLADGTFVNGELVRLGLCMSRAYGDDTRLQAVLDELEQQARAARLGAWAVATISRAYGLSTPGAEEIVIVQVYNERAIEFVEVLNTAGAPQDLSGWYVDGSRGSDRYTFPPGHLLPAGGTVRLHSGAYGVDAPPWDIYWTTRNVWNNRGEEVHLHDAGGVVVDLFGY